VAISRLVRGADGPAGGREDILVCTRCEGVAQAAEAAVAYQHGRHCTDTRSHSEAREHVFFFWASGVSAQSGEGECTRGSLLRGAAAAACRRHYSKC
jgi:hypothetical protein